MGHAKIGYKAWQVLGVQGFSELPTSSDADP